MSGHKYAGLPDIDTSPDVYETDEPSDPQPSDTAYVNEDPASSLNRVSLRSAPYASAEAVKDGLDSASLISAGEATKLFTRAERHHDRNDTDNARILFAYPPSPTSSTSSGTVTRRVPWAQRLRALQAELTLLESEFADPTDPQISRETETGEVDPATMLRGIAEIRSRLERIRRGKEGRERLVNVLVAQSNSDALPPHPNGEIEAINPAKINPETDSLNTVDIDRRVGVLEKVIGSSNVPLDETSPLPLALLPLLTRLNSQIAILTQPRHIDSVSRRLKLLLSDLDRISHHSQSSRKQTSQSTTPSETRPGLERLLPLLSRLGPSLPQIPHILTRLRTLSALHASAAEFQGTIANIEEEQRALRLTVSQLEAAVQAVEASIRTNKTLTAHNVEGLETRIKALMERANEVADRSTTS